jgi:hypothetical protein
MNNFLHRNFIRCEMDFELQIWVVKLCFEIRKLIKLARNRLKI